VKFRRVFNRAAFGLLSMTAVLFSTPERALAAELRAVASFSILGDLVRQVGGSRVMVETLIGPDADVHAFSPTPADAGKLADAQIVVINGLGLEGWIERLVKASKTRAPVVVATAGVTTIADADDHAGHGHDHGSAIDPHAWQNVANVKIYVDNIRVGLARAAPEDAAYFADNAARYTAALDALDRDVRAAIEALPPERRKVITTHNAFGYFAKAYGMAFIAPQGVSSDTEPSARQVGAIIRQIRRENVPAVFLENMSDSRLIARIAKEGGAKIGGTVFSDALSPADGPAATYTAMMRHNVREFVDALAPPR